jgi:3-hydroxybutyryl-CoA dehydratase
MTGLLHFDEMKVGDCWTSSQRTITESDVNLFANLTDDFDRLHVDHSYAAETPFRRPVVHGLLGLSMLAGLSSRCPWVATAAFIEISDWKFVKPIYFDDTVHVVTHVVEKVPKGRRRGKIIWKRQLINQHGDVVQYGFLESLVNVSDEERINLRSKTRKQIAMPRKAK